MATCFRKRFNKADILFTSSPLSVNCECRVFKTKLTSHEAYIAEHNRKKVVDGYQPGDYGFGEIGATVAADSPLASPTEVTAIDDEETRYQIQATHASQEAIEGAIRRLKTESESNQQGVATNPVASDVSASAPTQLHVVQSADALLPETTPVPANREQPVPTAPPLSETTSPSGLRRSPRLRKDTRTCVVCDDAEHPQTKHAGRKAETGKSPTASPKPRKPQGSGQGQEAVRRSPRASSRRSPPCAVCEE